MKISGVIASEMSSLNIMDSKTRHTRYPVAYEVPGSGMIKAVRGMICRNKMMISRDATSSGYIERIANILMSYKMKLTLVMLLINLQSLCLCHTESYICSISIISIIL